MEVPAGKVAGTCKLRNDVGRNVGCANVVTSVSLDAKRRVEGKGEDGFTYTNKLLRVLQGHGPLPVIVEVIGGPELGRASVVDAYVSLRIFAESGEDIAGIRRKARAVRRLQAPGLPAQKLPLAPLQVQPVEAKTVGMRIGSNKDVGRIVAVEIELHITGDVVLSVLGVGLDVEPGILSGGAIFREMPLDCIAEGNSPEIGRGHKPCIGAAKDVFKIHETAGSEIVPADAERHRRFFWLVLGGPRGNVHRIIRRQRSVDQAPRVPWG